MVLPLINAPTPTLHANPPFTPAPAAMHVRLCGGGIYDHGHGADAPAAALFPTRAGRLPCLLPRRGLAVVTRARGGDFGNPQETTWPTLRLREQQPGLAAALEDLSIHECLHYGTNRNR
jgi:hypothetical protein